MPSFCEITVKSLNVFKSGEDWLSQVGKAGKRLLSQ